MSNTQHEVMGGEQGDIAAEVSLLDFETFFRLFTLLLLSKMDICPAHASPITPPAAGSCAHLAKAQASGDVCGPTEIAGQLGLQTGLWVHC